jgi:drug/metabolite transporter (DMT)-like permease
LQRVSAVEASLLVLLEPILSPTWVAIFIGEMPSMWDLIGGAAILTALLLVAIRRSPQPATAVVAD